jgi:hypothetical protein
MLHEEMIFVGVVVAVLSWKIDPLCIPHVEMSLSQASKFFVIPFNGSVYSFQGTLSRDYLETPPGRLVTYQFRYRHTGAIHLKARNARG